MPRHDAVFQQRRTAADAPAFGALDLHLNGSGGRVTPEVTVHVESLPTHRNAVT